MKNLKTVFLKRCLPIMLSLSIMFSSMPMNVFAEEIVTDGEGTVTEHEHEHDEDGNCIIVEGEGEEDSEQPDGTQSTPAPTVEPTGDDGSEQPAGTDGSELQPDDVTLEPTDENSAEDSSESVYDFVEDEEELYAVSKVFEELLEDIDIER